MKHKRRRGANSRQETPSAEPACTPESLGLPAGQYEAALRYLFDRPASTRQQQEWYWNIDEESFEASPLEWVRIQTALFANAGQDLQGYSDEQVGMGLDYVMSNSVSDVPFAAIDPTVPLEEAMRMMSAMPALWRDCIGPRLAHVHAPIGQGAGSKLGFVCYMWFDVWPTFWHVRDVPAWRDALWNVFQTMLAVPCREVQIAALHGIGHRVHDLDRQPDIDKTILAFIRNAEPSDLEIRSYAEAARQGRVQ